MERAQLGVGLPVRPGQGAAQRAGEERGRVLDVLRRLRQAVLTPRPGEQTRY